MRVHSWRSQSPAQTPQRHVDPSPRKLPAPPSKPLLTVIEPLAADRPGVRHSEDHARPGVEPKAFNGHDTHWTRFAVPMPGAPRPSCPRCARGICAPGRAQWLAPLAATRANPRTCSALRVRPRTATSKTTRACRPCTAPASARPARCPTHDRHARSRLRRFATPRLDTAHPTRQPRRTRPRAIAPGPAH